MMASGAEAAALGGKKDGLLMAVSARDGEERAQWQFASPPVFDSMAVASRRLYLTAVNGSVCCFGPEKSLVATSDLDL